MNMCTKMSALSAAYAVDFYNQEVGGVQPSLGTNVGIPTGRNGVIEVDDVQYRVRRLTPL